MTSSKKKINILKQFDVDEIILINKNEKFENKVKILYYIRN